MTTLMRSGFLSSVASALVFSDNARLVEALSSRLEKDGFEVARAFTASDALQSLRGEWLDVVVLDTGRDVRRGVELCREVRRDPLNSFAAVVIHAPDLNNDDIVSLLRVGADQVICRMEDLSVFSAKARSLVRRRAMARYEQHREPTPVHQVGELLIRPENYEVFVRGRPVQLTLIEFRILSTLMGQVGRVFSRDQMMNVLYGHLADVSDRAIDSRVSMLRRKLAPLSDYVETVRGVGYRIVRPRTT